MKVINPFDFLTEFDHWFAFEVKRAEGGVKVGCARREASAMLYLMVMQEQDKPQQIDLVCSTDQ